MNFPIIDHSWTNAHLSVKNKNYYDDVAFLIGENTCLTSNEICWEKIFLLSVYLFEEEKQKTTDSKIIKS